jgi:hypothetical protein
MSKNRAHHGQLNGEEIVAVFGKVSDVALAWSHQYSAHVPNIRFDLHREPVIIIIPAGIVQAL